MSNISRVGARSLALLTVTAILGIGLQMAARGKMATHPNPVPPENANQSTGQTPLLIPIDERERDFARSTYRLYSKKGMSPIFVSITRAETLNAFRAPYEYLLDTDGRMLENRKGVIPREGEKLPVHLLEYVTGRTNSAMLLHWAQNWGGEPIADPLTIGQMLDTTIRHEPVFIVDVWSVFRFGGGNVIDEPTIIRLADYIDRMIKEKRLK